MKSKKQKRSSRKRMATRSPHFPKSIKGCEVIWESKRNGTYVG